MHGETMAVAAWCSGPLIHIEVLDQDCHVPELKRPAELSGPLSEYDLQERGRGLFLIDAFSERWGFAVRPPGKAVWFELTDPDLVGALG
ncbi:ATP-binding protein [Kitasatospora sp. NPDC088134]|uniref:ATP-binding protein n=1 Tax=Kitasatospora sp. NPDC088134 TaxID=3364071 RepID=UPI00382CB9B4